MLDKNLGIILFAVGIVYFLYAFISHKKSILTVFAVVAMLFGAALYQFPEKVNEIIETLFRLKK
jgi:membrane-bound ClpP family serine protease